MGLHKLVPLQFLFIPRVPRRTDVDNLDLQPPPGAEPEADIL